jgi:hypothetical protein
MARAQGLAAARETPAPQTAPLFRGLLEGMQDGARRVVLDLGPVRPATVALLGRYRCRLDIADIGEGLDAVSAATDAETLRTVFRQLLPRPRREPTAIVLCWDLLNYLERPAIRILMDELYFRLAPDARVHALIAYAAPRMPARPMRIAPASDLSLRFTPVTADEKTSPRYSPDDLARCMPTYTQERATLLRNGMQEFLFRR